MDKWEHGDAKKPLIKAGELRQGADREQRLILARLQEKGQIPGLGDATARQKAAVALSTT